jgi:uncharacterized RmlC-like cupin family protein
VARVFVLVDLVEVDRGFWHVRIGDAVGRVTFHGTREELLAELNGRQRALFGNALEGRMISIAGHVIRSE